MVASFILKTTTQQKYIIMAKTKKITLGAQSSYFHDPYTNTSIAKGEVVEIEESKLRTKRIRSAMASGHLEIATSIDVELDELDGEKLIKKITALATSGKDSKKAASAFNNDEVSYLCEKFEIEPEESDTKQTLVDALFAKIIEQSKN